MSHLRLLVFSFAVLISLAGALAAPPAALFAEKAVIGTEAGAARYNCELSLQLAANAPAAAAVQVALEWEKSAQYTLVTITGRQVTMAAVTGGKAGAPVQAACHITAPAHLSILRREGWLGVLLDESLILHAELPRGPGANASVLAEPGWSVANAHLQPLEPVIFSDDFMRTDLQGWTGQQGKWALQSAWDNDPKTRDMTWLRSAAAAQNPFSLGGSAAGGAFALCTANAGQPFWDDYTMTAAVQPSMDGAVGLVVNMADPRHGLVVRWSPVSDRGPQGDRITLCRLADGKLTTLAESHGGFLPGQWAQLAVTSSLRDGITVAVDGHPRLTAPLASPVRGSVGLYTESTAGAIFDDVTVYGHTLKKDLITEQQTIRFSDKFQNDPDMKAWAQAQSDWAAKPGAPACWFHRFDFFGDHWIVATVTSDTRPAGQLTLALNSDGKDPATGDRAVAQIADGKLTSTLYRGAEKLAAAKVEAGLTAGEEYTFRFLREGNTLRLQRDGVTVLEAVDPTPLSGLRPAYSAEGALAQTRDVQVLGRNVLDYTFANAPVDWLEEGTWMPSIRWSCAPEWSFLGGWSRGDAVLWHKQRFTGDQTLQAFLGIKMEYPREQAIYEDRYRAIAVTICGDGHDPRNGYAVIFGAPDEKGNPNRRTVLLRNGVVVASAKGWQDRMPDKVMAHHTWFNMVLQKHGDTIDFQVRFTSKNMWWAGDPGREVVVSLSYKDPDPLTGGIPAIWTPDNGINVARARLFFANAPQPRDESYIPMVQPDYPEWMDVGKALTLRFPPLWSSAGKPAHLQVTPAAVPAGEETQAVVGENTVTLTPKKAGEHWYKVTATDGAVNSPAAHLALPVFDTAGGRDDTHTLLLYRFDEGKGSVVHDHAAQGAAADLTIPEGAHAHWLSGRGLAVNGPAPLKAVDNLAKLMAIQKAQACTFEFWVSAGTTDTPTRSEGGLLSWGDTGVDNVRNFSVYHNWYNLDVSGPGAHFVPREQKWAGPHWGNIYWQYQFHPWLEHVVLTWDGNTVHSYFDGKEWAGNGDLTGFTEKWDPAAPLYVGNIANLSQQFIGALYLVALHDRCLTSAEVQRHYQAGPDAQ